MAQNPDQGKPDDIKDSETPKGNSKALPGDETHDTNPKTNAGQKGTANGSKTPKKPTWYSKSWNYCYSGLRLLRHNWLKKVKLEQWLTECFYEVVGLGKLKMLPMHNLSRKMKDTDKSKYPEPFIP